MKRKWMSTCLVLAGAYNILWGAYTVLFPSHFFDFLELKRPEYLEFWQCIGMIVGVYGLGYIVAAKSPLKHWPIVLVGLLGKVFGPIGFVQAILTKGFPLAFGVTIITNDLIWWAPFSLILYNAYQSKRCSGIKRLNAEEINNLEDRKRARFINSLSGFKSVNLLGTKSKAGETNLSIISSTFHLGANPPLLGFIIRPDSSPRHSLDNLRETSFCTLNHVHSEILLNAHQTSARYPKEKSEFDECQLTEEYLNNFHSPFVSESRIKLALELVREEKIQENGTHLIIAKIQDTYFPEDCLMKDGFLDIEKAGSLTVSGLDSYHSTDRVSRLSYAKVDKGLESI